MKNAVIYARYSSSSQDEQTIEMQIKKCREYAEKNDLIILNEYVDEAKSGRSGKRSGLQQILSDSKEGRFQYVITYMSDRYYRNTSEALFFEQELNKNGVRLLYTLEVYDDTPWGTYMKTINYANNQLYSDLYSLKISNGLENNASKCLSIGNGSLPFGYKSADKQIIIAENEAPYVKEIFEMYKNGKTMAEIIRHLNSLGIKTKRKSEFNKNSIKRILKNRRYLGIYIYKEKETPNAIPRIIDDDLFEEVQALLEKNQKAPGRRRAKEEYLLTTKLFCGNCKEMMVGYPGTSKNGSLYYYYACKNAKLHKCEKKNVRKEYVEELVFDVVSTTLTPENIDEIAKNVVEMAEKKQDFNKLKDLEKALKRNDKEKNNLIEAVAECSSPIIRKSLYDKLQDLEEQSNHLKKEIYKEEKGKIKINVNQVKFFLGELKKKSYKDIKTRKKLINIIINRVYLHNEEMEIVLNTQDKEVRVNIKDLEEESSFIGSSSPPN